MRDWSDDDVSPYLLRPLRSYAQAVEDVRRHDAAWDMARSLGSKGKLIHFPRWRRRKPVREIAQPRRLRHPA